MNLDNFDLNLIRVFLAIAKHRNVTEASRELHLTQSSVSHALARLRSLCNDPLFVRSSGAMAPTVVAQAMIEPLEQALKSVRQSLGHATPFDPRTSERRFNLLLTDVGQTAYLPALLAYLGEHAPSIGIDVLHLPMDGYPKAFADGVADLAVGYMPTLYGGFHHQVLFTTPQVCMLRADHPDIRQSISLEQYLAATHVVVEPPGRGPGVVEKALGKARLQRRIAVRLPNISAGPLIVRRTRHIMTVPAQIDVFQGGLTGIVFLPLPFDVEVMDIGMLWHERTHNDPANRWLRKAMVEIFRMPAPTQQPPKPVAIPEALALA
ncbi:LysR family transcriptional regulator [Ottowia pentelensis]|uniref:LysR family transcriptional regulator n=1 Tax=Ottowia pentelensis TaxID=511108 RepID=UPI0036254D7E